MECFLSAGQGDLGTTWGLQPSPFWLGKCPVQCPSMATSLPLAVLGYESAHSLLKAGPLVFMPSPQETATAGPALLSRGPGSSLYKHAQPVRAEGTAMV